MKESKSQAARLRALLGEIAASVGSCTVVLVHEPSRARKEVQVSMVGKLVRVHWELAGLYDVALSSGRLKGNAEVRAWRVHRWHLTALRDLVGWKPWRFDPSNKKAAAPGHL